MTIKRIDVFAQNQPSMAPLGSFYDPLLVVGARAGLAELAPKLPGFDCCNVHVINAHRDRDLNGLGGGN